MGTRLPRGTFLGVRPTAFAESGWTVVSFCPAGHEAGSSCSDSEEP